MFKKKPNLKSLAPLRSSDRRKLIDLIIKQYDIVVSSDQKSDEFKEGAVGVNAFRNSILPDGALYATFSTTAGPDLKVVKGVVYVGSYHGESQRILWVKQDNGGLIPTVYTLWRHPMILPLLHTPAAVVLKMREGAELNTPGLAMGPPFPQNATKGSIVAVASCERPSVPVVVGVCEIDVSSLTEVRGQKGHAVRPLHWEGDELWNWGQFGQGGGVAPEHIEDWFLENTKNSDTKESQGNLSLADEEARYIDQVGLSSKEDIVITQQVHQEKGPSRDWTVKEIDDAFRQAFLYSLHQSRNKNKSDANHGIDFPVSQSQFISGFITPYLPSFSDQDASALQIKKTSWKSARKFIKFLEKELLLKSKDRNGGETVVLDIDFDDPAVLAFHPYRLPPKQPMGTESAGKVFNSQDGFSDISIGQRLKRLTMLRPKEKLSSVFGGSGSQNLYLPNDIKPIVTNYIETEMLIDHQNKRLVKLDAVLANSVFDTSSSLDQEVLTKGLVSRDVLINRVIDGCLPFWVILRNEESLKDAKPKPGKPPTIKIHLETRGGNKTVTKISSLEAFHINPQALAEELQRACASSTSVNALPGSNSKHPFTEVMVQGPQKDAVIRALEKRGVKENWVETTDKTKGKKR